MMMGRRRHLENVIPPDGNAMDGLFSATPRSPRSLWGTQLTKCSLMGPALHC
jgi:hypothetical protein